MRPRRPLALVIAAALGAAGLWLAGLVAFANAIPRPGPVDERATDAIVVLTGGSGRIEAGEALLLQGRAGVLFVSGVPAGVDIARLLPGLAPERIACCVAAGRIADSTAGNARETAEWMNGRQLRSLRLVTSSYHMPRSLAAFRRAMPEVAIVPHPVFPDAVRGEDWWRWPGTASLIASEYVKHLAAAAMDRLGVAVP